MYNVFYSKYLKALLHKCFNAYHLQKKIFQFCFILDHKLIKRKIKICFVIPLTMKKVHLANLHNTE